MKRFFLTVSLLLVFCVGVSAQKITFTPQWTPQAQFAGMYVAYDKGFYADEGLDVDIVHVNSKSSISAIDMLVRGESDIISMQLLQAIVQRSDGRPVVNVMQITQKSGLCCVTRTPVSGPEDLEGMNIGRWKTGFAELGNIIVDKLGVNVNWVPFANGLALCITGAIDAALCYSFNELVALKLAMGTAPEENILMVDPEKMPCPEDGLYVTQEYYDNNKEAIDKFVRATAKGWDYARENREETVDICFKFINRDHVVTNRTHQEMMLDEYLKLMENADGVVDYSSVTKPLYQSLASDLMDIGYITNIPEYEDIIK